MPNIHTEAQRITALLTPKSRTHYTRVAEQLSKQVSSFNGCNPIPTDEMRDLLIWSIYQSCTCVPRGDRADTAIVNWLNKAAALLS